MAEIVEPQLGRQAVGADPRVVALLRMTIDDVAKEVGLTHLLKGNVIVIVTTGTVDAQARRYANRVMADSNLAIVLIDGRDLKTIASRPTRIVDIFERDRETGAQTLVDQELQREADRSSMAASPVMVGSRARQTGARRGRPRRG